MAHLVQLRNSLIILLLIFLQSCSSGTTEEKPVYNASQIKVYIKNTIVMNGDEPFTGIIYGLQPNSKDTSEIVSFKMGREDGVWKKFYPGGRLAEIRYFKDGKKTGFFKAWWSNGKQKLDYIFVDGEYNGTCREWAESGLMVSEMNYKQGYEEGSQKQYYADGKIKANYIMTGGRRYGLLGTKNCVNVADKIFKK